MAISINNSVANINGTPGAASGVFSDRPAAADVADGTLYFATDTVAIYQNVSGSWVDYSGGGGGGSTGINGLNGTTSIGLGGNLNQDTNIFGYGFSFYMQYVKDFLFLTNNNTYLQIQDDFISTTGQQQTGIAINFANNQTTIGNWGTFYNGTKFIVDDDAQIIKSTNTNVDIGLFLDFGNQNYQLGLGNYVGFSQIGLLSVIGDYTGSNLSGTTFNVNPDTEIIYTLKNGDELGLKLNFAANVFDFGEVGNNNYIRINNQSGLSEYSANTQMFLYSNNAGIVLDGNGARIGDPDVRANGTYIGIDDANETLIASANSITTNNGTAIGQHLKIMIGGIDYVIQLRLA